MVTLKYRITAMELYGDDVILRLSRFSENTGRSPSIIPAPESLEEKMMFSMFQAMRKYLPAVLGSQLPQQAFEEIRSTVILSLTREEYEELGKPTVGDYITIELKSKDKL